MAIVIGFIALLLAVSAFAIWRGGAPERVGAAASLVAAAATVAANLPRENDFEVFEFEIFAIDAALLAVFLWLSVKANRFWPLYATSFHSVSVAVHIAKAANPALVAPVYAFASTGTSLLVLLTLWIGTVRHQRRRRFYGSDPPWRHSSRT